MPLLFPQKATGRVPEGCPGLLGIPLFCCVYVFFWGGGGTKKRVVVRSHSHWRTGEAKRECLAPLRLLSSREALLQGLFQLDV